MSGSRRGRLTAALLIGTVVTAITVLVFPVPGSVAASEPAEAGRILPFGAAQGHGAPAADATVAGLASSAGGAGYWVALADGTVQAYGDVASLGSFTRRDTPVIDLAANQAGDGYWLVTGDGVVQAFGQSRHHGDLASTRLNQPIVALTPTRSGEGYWLVAADGGVFSFGDARYQGSTGAMRLNSPVVAAAADPSGAGYWLAAADGGVFSFGSATYHGSLGAEPGPKAVAIAAAPDGGGYLLARVDGHVRRFGSAADHGSASGTTAPVADLATRPAGDGYWLLIGQQVQVKAQSTPGAVEYQPQGTPPGEPPDSDFDRLAHCESTSRWNLNTGNGYYGGLQFSAATWRGLGGPGLPHQHSRETQIDIARRQWRQSGWRAWPHCSRALGLR